MRPKAALPTSAPGDSAERDADALAHRVMRQPAGAPPEQVPPQGPLPVARAAEPAGGTKATTPMLAGEHLDRLGSGQPLPPDTQALFEQRFGQSLAQVRVLDDSAAAAAAASIDARAFTLGNRIGFAAGQYQPNTPAGQWLLAHEIAHVLQQGSFGAVPRMVMRLGGSGGSPGAGGGGGSGGGGGGGAAPGGVARAAATGAPRYVLHTTNPLRVPPIKARHSPTYGQLARAGWLIRPRGYDASTRATAQVAAWTSGVNLNMSLLAAHRPAAGTPWNLQLEHAGGVAARPPITAANDVELQAILKRPTWNNSGTDVDGGFQVDHMVEYQLGGNDHIDNLELLDQAHNGSVGSSFNHEIRRAVRQELAANRLPPPAPGATPTTAMSVDTVFATYDIEFSRAEGRARESRRGEGDSRFWSKQAIENLEHVLGLLPSGGSLAGSPTVLHVLSPTGNLIVLRLPIANNAISVPAAQRGGIAGFEVGGIAIDGGLAQLAGSSAGTAGIGRLTGTLNLGPSVNFPQGGGHTLGLQKAAHAWAVKIESTAGTPPPPAGSGGPNNATLVPAEFRPMSPLDIRDVQVGRALVARATLRPSHPALAGLELPAEVRNGRLGIFYTVDATTLAQRLRIPGLTIDAAAITFGYDGTNFSVDGGTEFSIRNFGQGFLNAMVDTGGHFALEGGFRADPRLFDRAEMRLWYRSEGGFGGEGTLAITNPTKIRGIRAASVTARYAQGVFSATGTVEPQIPGLQSAGLSVRYGPDESGAHSLLIAGDLALAAGVPGARGGNVHVEVLQRDEQWRVAASGEIQPAIPGVNATLRASYREGAFIASVEAPFTVGERISGNLLVGVTNQQTDAEGRPMEGSTLADTLSGFGRGTATIRLSDQFQGNFGIRVASDASVRVSGSVGIAQPITLFDQRRWSRELVRVPTISIPIFGFAVGGNVVGIAATLGGGIDAEANVGPGQITEGRIGVEDFNPARPESLHVTGRVTFAVPATAGINGRLDAGISAGLAVVRATGGASIVLGLGVDAGARAQLDLDWTPAAGLVLAATLSASATPRLRASINGFAEVVADAFVTSFTLWRKDWRLAQREFGSGLTVGVSVPVTWRQTTGLDFDFNRVQFQVPEISAESALAGLLRDEGSTQRQNETNR